MNHKILLILLLAVTSLSAADNLATMLKEGKTSGQIRFFHVDRDYEGTILTHRNASAFGGHLKFETADYKGLSFGTAFYTSNRVLQSTELNVTDPSLWGPGAVSQTILGEAYLNYKSGMTNFKAGRQKLATPLAGGDDVRMIPNLFEAFVLRNKSIKNTTLTLGQVTAFAPGTFAHIYKGGIVGATSGYTYDVNNTGTHQGLFTNMGTWAVGEKTSGVTVAGIVYKNKGMKLQLWDYAAADILNAVYVQADMSYGDKGVRPFLSLQAIKENSLGDKFLQNISGDGEIDSLYWAAKVGVKNASLSAYIAYSETGANEDNTTAAYKNAIITPWGGTPAFTQGMVMRHQFLAGTKATKAAVAYTKKENGSKFSASAYYVEFNMDANNGYSLNHAWTASEYGFDFKYNPAIDNNLQLRFRGNFPQQFKDEAANDGFNWAEYRVIVNYTFK